MKQKEALYKTLDEFINPEQRPHESGILGNFVGVVDVPNRISYVYVRLSSGVLVEAYNNLVPSLLNLNVLVGTNPQRTSELKVLDVLLDMHPDGIGIPLIQKHGASHEWPASDTVYISYRQLLPLRPTVETGLEVSVNPGWYINSDRRVKYFAGTQANLNMGSYLPTTGSRWALITLDSSGTIDVITDGTGTGYFDLTVANIPAVPENEIAIAAIKCRAGQTTIKDNALSSTELVDLRLAPQPSSSSSGGGTWGSITGTLSNQTDLQSALDGKQALDSDLTAIAGLSPSNDDVIQRKAGAWVGRTMAQLAADLPLSTAEVLPNDIYRVAPESNASLWTGTISSVSGADVVVTTATGNIVVLTVNATNQYAKLRLYNTTRSNYALISQTVTGTNTVTLTATAPVGWAADDSLTIASQTVSGASRSWVDLEITSGITRSQIYLDTTVISTAAHGGPLYCHPLETYADSKVLVTPAHAASIANVKTDPFVAGTAFAIAWLATVTTVVLRYKGYLR